MPTEVMQLIQLGVTLAAVVWTVASIRTTTVQLAANISSLRESVDRLQKWLSSHGETLTDHEGRLGRLEGRHDRD